MDRETREGERGVPAEVILASIANPVVLLDAQERILDANPAMARLADASRDGIVGRRWSAVLRPASDDPESRYQAIVDGRGSVRRFLWTDAEGPDGTVIRVGAEVVDGDPEEPAPAARTPGDEGLLAEARRRVDEAETLRQASAVVLQSLELQDAIQGILEQLAFVLPYDSASVQLLREGELEIVGGRGWEDPTDVIGMRFPTTGDNPNTEIVRQRKPVVLSDAPQAYGEFRKPPHDHIRSFLGVPLVARDRVIGLLTIDSREPDHFTDDDIRLASAFANQVAIAIENARLYSELQKLSTTDPLTRLYNRRGLYELGRHELERARRFGHPLSVLMIDLDRFKAINDTHGHGVGDDVLTALARRGHEVLREVDYLSRHGGEEFVALLPETDLDEARRTAERLRHEVERRPFETEAGAFAVTISIGVAVWEPSMADLDALLALADRALYKAKQTGRNRVCHAPPAA